MNTDPGFDVGRAHRFFAAACFNQTWMRLEKAERSATELEEMRCLAHASLWHWQQRPDCTARNLSIGYHLLSRVYAILGRGPDAAAYGVLAHQHAQNDKPFFVGYAHEAMARAAVLNRDWPGVDEHLRLARELHALVQDEEGHRLLGADLNEIAKLREHASGPGN